MATKIRRFWKKFKWWISRNHQDCKKFCITCKHFNICVADEYYWRLENENR